MDQSKVDQERIDRLAKRFRNAKGKKAQEKAFSSLAQAIHEETAKAMESELRAERPDGETMKMILY